MFRWTIEIVCHDGGWGEGEGIWSFPYFLPIAAIIIQQFLSSASWQQKDIRHKVSMGLWCVISVDKENDEKILPKRL